MVKINLESVENGIIKSIEDDNINGAGSKLELKKVYDFDTDKDYKNLIKFITEILDDLGVNTGNVYDKKTLKLNVSWGESYQPTAKDIERKIKQKSLEIEALALLLKEENDTEEN